MAKFTDRIRGIFGQVDPARPFAEQGVPGFAVYGGYIVKPETNSDLIGPQRYRTASDLLANISIIAASLRFTLNLISRPKWKFDAPSDKPEAKAMAELVEEMFDDIDESWTRIVRRAGMYRYHGFGIHEWIAKKRDDGKVGLKAIESRPQHTIKRWNLDDSGNITGVWQNDPQTGREIYLPRAKQLYLVDDTITDSPDGMGWFRHLAEPANRLKSYLELEAIGFERDLGGIPIGRAPLQQLNDLVKSGKLTATEKSNALSMITEFVRLKRKDAQTALVLDSTTYRSKSENGESVSPIYQWGMELLTGSQNSIKELGEAVHRLEYDMALIMGTESMLIGRQGAGSHALSKDKSRNMFLTANATLADMAESVDRDLVSPIWTMNGFPDELKPKVAVEDVAFKDIAEISMALAEMAAAGAILPPDDPAINDLRDLMGISRAEPMDIKTLNALQGRPDPTKPSPDNQLNDQRARDSMANDNEQSQIARQEAAKQPPQPKPGQPAAARKAEPKALYASRRLLNSAALIKWAKQAGFAKTVPAEELHVTVCFSKQPIDWMGVPEDWSGDPDGRLRVAPGGPRMLDRFGDDGNAIVLLFKDQSLEWRADQFKDAGASYDHGTYQPHITITYDGTDLDLDAIPPYQGELIFGPEIFAPLNPDWKATITEKRGIAVVEKFNASQPRDPAGSPTGGQWTSGGGGAPSVMFEVAPNPDNKELTDRWNKLSDDEKQKITQEIAGEVTPKVLEHLGVKGELVSTIGGFEGQINPSLELRMQTAGKEVATAAFLGDGLSQKSMVIASAKPMKGLEPVGIAAIQVPSGERDLAGIKDLFAKASKAPGVDGFTFRNGQMEILNFSGHSIDAFAKNIDSALGEQYRIKQSTIYSTLLEAPSYASGKGNTRGNSGRKFSDSLRESVQASLQEKLSAVGKRLEGEAGGIDKAFNPSEARDEHGRWTNGVQALSNDDKKRLRGHNAGKDVHELRAMAAVNQDELRKVGNQIEAQQGVKFSDTEIKSLSSIQRKVRDEGYAGPHELTDLSRVSFTVDKPGDATPVIESLGKGARVFDKGWTTLPGTNYVDRKLLVQHANGGISEIQIIPRPIAAIKGVKGVPGGGVFNGAGHRLYEIARDPRKPQSIRDRATSLSSRLYSKAVRGTPFASMVQ